MAVYCGLLAWKWRHKFFCSDLQSFEDALNWCFDNLTDGTFKASRGTRNIFIESKKDATMFRLRWA